MEKNKAMRPLGPVVRAGQEEPRIEQDAGVSEATLQIADRREAVEIGVAIDLVGLYEGPERVRHMWVSERDAGAALLERPIRPGYSDRGQDEPVGLGQVDRRLRPAPTAARNWGRSSFGRRCCRSDPYLSA